MSTEEIEKYKRGFNHGYIMSKENPELLKTLLKGKHENALEYFEGLREGQLEFEKELKLEKLKAGYHASTRQKEKGDREKEL